MSDKEEEMLVELYDGGRWFQLPKVFLLIMSSTEAILMAYLINYSNLVKSKKNDGWFYCKRERIHKNIFITLRRQTDLFKSLEGKGFIQTKWMGQPGLRWIKINTKAVYDKAKSVSQAIEAAGDDDMGEAIDEHINQKLHPRVWGGSGF